jgi:hypothetical protein
MPLVDGLQFTMFLNLEIRRRYLFTLACGLLTCACTIGWSAELSVPPLPATDQVSNAAQCGYDYLINTPYLTSDFDQETFDTVKRRSIASCNGILLLAVELFFNSNKTIAK